MSLKPRKLNRALFAAVLAFAAAGSWSLAAEDAPPNARAVVVLDSSAAMLNPLENFKKYYWVRKTLQSQMATPLPGLDVGLVAYGHRRRADCADVEALRPISRFDAGEFLNSAFSVRPHGEAPVSEALKAAAAALGKGGGKILLIAGSADSCQQDPCAAARDLVTAEPGLAIDVLSIGASAADASQFRCIADAGHGQVYANTTLVDAAKSFADAFAALTVAPGLVVPAPSAVVPPVGSGLVLSAQLAEGGASVGLSLKWVLRKLDAGKPGAIVFQADAPTVSAPLPPGFYDVEATAGGLDVHQTAEVQAEKPTVLPVILNAGSLRLRSGAGLSGDLAPETTYTVYRRQINSDDDPIDTSVAMLRDPMTAPLLLPAGSYRAVANRGMMHEERIFDLAAGQELSAAFALASGKLQIEAETGGDAKAGAPIYFVSEDDPDQPLGRRDVAQSTTANPVFDLPPGAYHVFARQGAGQSRLDAVVKAGEVTKLTFPLSIGRLRLETQGLPKGPALPEDLISYKVERLDESGSPVSVAARSSSAEPSIELEAGAYRVTGKVGLVNISATTDVTVRAGAEARAVLAQQFGVLDLSYGDEAAAAADILWEVRNADGKAVWSTTVAAPLVPLAAGEYSIHALRLGKDQSVDVRIVAGDRKVVAIRPE